MYKNRGYDHAPQQKTQKIHPGIIGVDVLF
jgi:hypothetical protein